jgi:hypothetical protein
MGKYTIYELVSALQICEEMRDYSISDSGTDIYKKNQNEPLIYNIP